MRVLVTGGAGFLGRWFMQHHMDAGDEVHGIDDFSNPHSRWPAAYHPANSDHLDLAVALERIDASVAQFGNNKFDRIYHFAAPVGGRVKIEGDPLFNADSLRLDSVMFRWAVGHTPVLVYPSSSAVYGRSLQGSGATALAEEEFNPESDAWFAPDEMYGFTKLAGERLALAAAKYGLTTLCIRPFSGYGEGQSLEYPVPSIAARALKREDPLVVWGPGTQTRDFIHVSDLVGATIARLDDEDLEGYNSLNIGTGKATSFNEIAAICADIAGYSPTIQNIHDAPMGVQNRYAEVSQMLRYYTPKVALREGLERVMASL